MRICMLLLAGIGYLVSCGEKMDTEPSPVVTDSVITDTVTILNKLQHNLNVQTNSFSEIDTSGVLMFPLSISETDNERSSYKRLPKNSLWNIAFYNTKTEDYFLLSERKMLIQNFNVEYNNGEFAAKKSKYIFYSVIIDDYNKDKKLNADDPEYLFMTDREGKNFRQISPPDYHIKTWQLIHFSNKVVMTVTRDSNNDKEFGDKDEVSTFEVKMEANSIPKEVFSKDFKNKIRLLFDRDWKVIKE